MADQSQTFHAVIEVVNRATAPLRQINAQIAGLTVPITAVKIAMGELAVQTGITAIGEDAVVAMEKVGELGRSLGELVAPLAVVGGLASLAGIFEAGKKNAEFGSALLAQHERTGIEVPVLARLHYIGQQTEADPDQLDKALERLNANIFKARGGKDKDLAAMFQKFAGAGWKRTITDAGSALGMISEAMRKNENAAVRAGIVTTAFGARVGNSLTPMLLKGKDAMAEMAAESDKFFGVWTEERAEQAKQQSLIWGRLASAGQGLAMTIGSAVAPSLMKAIAPLTDWIAQNRLLVAMKVDHVVAQIASALRNVNWAQIGAAVMSIGRAFKRVADTLGARGTVFLGVGLLFGPMIFKTIEAVSALRALGVQIVVTAAKIGILTVTQVAAFFADFVTGIRLAIPAMSALDLAMDANPIGAVVIAGAALAGVAYEIYRSWAPIGGFLGGVWARIKGSFAPAKQYVSDVWRGIALVVGQSVSAISEKIAPLSKLFRAVWNDIGQVVTSVWAKISPVFDIMGKGFATLAGLVGDALKVLVLTSAPVMAMQSLHDIGQADRLAQQRSGIPSVPAIVPQGLVAIGGEPVIMPKGLGVMSGGSATDTGGGAVSGPSVVNRPVIQQRSAAPAGGAAALGEGKLDISVNFDSLPRGTTTKVTNSSGNTLNVGKSWQNP